MSTAFHFTVLNPLDFIKDVSDEAKHAKKRVWAQAMEIEPGDISDTFLSIFEAAAKKNLDTRLHADYFTLMVTDGTFNYWPVFSAKLRKHKEKSQTVKEQLYRRFTGMGIQFRYTNPPTLLDRVFPMRGRNHMKIVIVDDIAWIGGVNFNDYNFLIQDFMVKITDRSIVHEIAYVYEQVDKQIPLRDMAITCTDNATLLIDGGRINRSIILRHSLELITNAEQSIRLISQIIPDAEILKALHQAKNRGVVVSIITPKINKTTGIMTWVDKFNAMVMNIRGLSLPIDYKNKMIHAKLLMTDEKEAIFGSHNFSSRGVRMGTEEIALRSTDPTLVKNLLKFYTDTATL
jgi:phosphatidylserine/phosphatidylglycerophosphate/cardiolipin synthase-like enzyme